MKRVAIIEYGVGNLDSVRRAVEECGATPVVTNDSNEIRAASYIILPGVGAFGQGIRNLRSLHLDEVLSEHALKYRIPFLGICLGMQMMATSSWEGGSENEGLGWIEGVVQRLQPRLPSERVPHVGWNEVLFNGNTGSPLSVSLRDRDFYFVHSYAVQCPEQFVLARTEYCGGFVSAFAKENLIGVQFHPEKSQRAGLQFLRNFLSL